MFTTAKTTRNFNPDSIVILVIVFFALLIYNNSSHRSVADSKKPVSNLVTVNDNIVSDGPAVQFHIYKKIRSLNINPFFSTSLKQDMYCESKIISHKVFRIQLLRLNSIDIPQFLLRYHFFPSEKDEPPLLS
jgi:hypothetical protein